MKYEDEESIKKALDISSFRNLSKEKITRFAAMMPDMDKEVRLKIIEQFPAFKDYAVDVVRAMDKSHKRTLSANRQSQDHVHLANQDVRRILEDQLSNDDLSWEQRKELIAELQETAKRDADKDSENKQFLDGMLGKALMGAGGALVASLVFFGARHLADDGELLKVPKS